LVCNNHLNQSINQSINLLNDQSTTALTMVPHRCSSGN